MKKVTFAALVRKGPRQLVIGWQLRCGAVVHRSVFANNRFGASRDDCWTVSDPVSGATFVNCAWSLGDAVKDYRALQAKLGANFHSAIAMQRQLVQQQAQRENP
ncbi:MAG: hypothetical protein PHU77_00635 [Simplicispira sp.]|nr:hypothetical protein [Simplicispira sp.]